MIDTMPAPGTGEPSIATLSRAVESIRQRTGFVPEVALILGSGLGPLADEIAVEAKIPYDEIPGMTRSTAPGHAGTLYLGRLEGRPVVAMKGRLHLYDGVSAQAVGFPVRMMKTLGATSLVVSNACGGLDPAWSAGELMLQTDFINATGANSLIGPNDDARGPRFPVLFDCYDAEYQRLAREAAEREGITLREGVYLAVSGPSYATRAELRAFRRLGADAIGMSTVHEVLVARHESMRVLGISCITDMALPDATEHVTGDEVVAVAERSGEVFRRLVRRLLPVL
jgi:purine-nucleoside phosphorylase